MPKNINITLYRPHSGQETILKNHRRFNAIVCARRFGKTELIVSVALPLISPAVFEGKLVGVFVDDFKDFAQSWNKIIETFRLQSEGGLIVHKDETSKIIRFLNGGVLEVWSIGDEGRKEKGRGRKYHRVIYEETQKIPSHILEYHWKTVARPTLTDFKGEAFFIGTAAGKDNYWYRLCQNGARAGAVENNCYGDIDLPQSENGTDSWITFRMETTKNPLIDPAEVEDAARDLDRLTFEQEYKSVFVDYSGEAWVYVLKEKALQQKVFQPSKPINWDLEEIYISFDFNKIPMTAAAMKKTSLPLKSIEETKYIYGVHIVKEFKIGSIERGEASIYDTCKLIREWIYSETGKKIGAWYDGETIKARYPCTVPILITGDASGDRSDGRQKQPKTYYEIIQDELQLPRERIKVPAANPLHADSYVQVNTIISKCPDFQIYEDKCTNLRMDVLRIKANNSRQIMKGKGEERQADLLDNLRYLLNTFCKDIRK
jgi:hypothetical protein